MNTNSSPIFSVGEKVICINDAFSARIADWCDVSPVAGHGYTIRAMQIRSRSCYGILNLGFLLAEIINPTSSNSKEAGFLQDRFFRGSTLVRKPNTTM